MRTLMPRALGTLSWLLAVAAPYSHAQIPAENTVWKFNSGAIHTAPVTNDTAAFFGSMDQKFYAIDLRTGQAYWSYRAPGIITSNAALQDTVVCFESRNQLFGLSVRTGQQLWSFVDRNTPPTSNWDSPTKFHHSSPVIRNHTAYYGDEWGNINGVDLLTGALNFQVTIGEGSGAAIRCNPAISGDTLYFGNYGGDLYAISLRDSSIIWQRNIYAPLEDLANDVYRGSVVSGIRIENDLLFFGGFNNSFSPVNRFTGEEQWHYTDGQTYLPSTPLLFGERIIIGTTIFSFQIHCLNAITGRTEWSINTDGVFFTQPIIVEHSVLVMNSSDPFGDRQGKLYFIDALKGKILRQINLPEATESSPVWVDGDILLGSNNGLYRIDYRSFIEGYIPENLETKTNDIHLEIPSTVPFDFLGEINNRSSRADTISCTCAPVSFSMQGIELTEYTQARIEGFGKLHYGIRIEANSVAPGDYSFTFTTVDLSHADTFRYERTITITVLPPSVIDNQPGESALRVFPNPFQDELTFDLSGIPEGAGKLSIYNPNGQLIFSETYTDTCQLLTWHAEQETGQKLKTGLYFYRIQLNGTEWVGKIVKN